MQGNVSRQFTLRTLLAFVALCLMYCSQFTVAQAAFSRDIGWTTTATIALTWLCLAIFYYCRRLFVLFAWHLLSPVVLGGLSIACAAAPGNAATVARDVVIVGLAANLVSFPTAVLILFARAIGRQPAPK